MERYGRFQRDERIYLERVSWLECQLFFESSSELTDFSKLIVVDGKTIRGNRGKHQSPTHIVTAYDGGNRNSLVQVAVEDKSNEIPAIPRLLRQLDHRKSVVMIDAVGTQTDIADVTIGGKGDSCILIGLRG